MNFQTIPPVPSAKELLDVVFRKARERAQAKKFSGELWQRLQKRELLKVEIVSGNLLERLEQLVRQFPSSDMSSPFYRKLLHVTLDISLFKKSLGTVQWAKQQTAALQRQYTRRIAQERKGGRFPQLTKEFYGRISSILQQIDPQLKHLEIVRRVLRTYPDIKEGLFTVCLYGFPNVGKTTLLNALAKTKAKTAAYVFTTLTINVGYMFLDGHTVQVLDVPGTLARSEKMNPIEQQAELVLRELADIVVFVLDPSGQSGYSLVRQTQLFAKVEKEKDVVLFLGKSDLLSAEQRAEYPEAYADVKELQKELFRRAERKKPGLKTSPEVSP